MNMPAYEVRNSIEERIAALSDDHQRGILRFRKRILQFTRQGMLSEAQCAIVSEHLVRLGERNRNPANTGNIEDLFCHTLIDTQDPIRAFAQALADSVKVVPMDEDAPLRPAMRTIDGSKYFRKVSDFGDIGPGDKMLVTHTMVAYGDPEMWSSAVELVRVTHPKLSDEEIQREVAKMAVQSQHLPSSSFVLARAAGLTIDCGPLYRDAGYSEAQTEDAQRFYDICAGFDPQWATNFVAGSIPRGEAWVSWRRNYLNARAHLPPELIYQLSSDTLTNFLEGTMESGKWTDASVFFNGVTDPAQLPGALAKIVNQYIAEHVALHDKPASELTVACAEPLRPWGVGFEDDSAVILPEAPEKADLLKAQFDLAWARKTG